ncbi:pathogenicity island protein [Staphylococcus epidermidis]|uniref:pathogenicity island protein n=1 Tax=Staphylococcus epidermidis TaxID=1282 RepID=UPI001EF8A527|nr:pathogenicity island protein [Staphylococcus epidermidis]MCG7834330.1 pathogenicity island protein [Staphylococcus epidermidis]MDF1461807.1 pathogenicity island protein [Staphylococcus epidermidis]
MQVVKEDYNLDEKAQSIGLITGISKEIYYCSISYVSTVYLEFINDSWTAWRESYIPKSNKRTSYKVIATGSFELVIARLKNYLNYIKRSK